MTILLSEEIVCRKTGSLLWDSGEPTSEGLKVYTEGDCWALAWHLSKLVEDAGYDGGLYTLGKARSWGHVVVKVDEDEYLDINGLSSASALAAEWFGYGLYEIPARALGSLAAYMDFLDTDFVFEADEYEANKIALAVVEKYLPW